jgi:hypothetical protein
VWVEIMIHEVFLSVESGVPPYIWDNRNVGNIIVRSQSKLSLPFYPSI